MHDSPGKARKPSRTPKPIVKRKAVADCAMGDLLLFTDGIPANAPTDVGWLTMYYSRSYFARFLDTESGVYGEPIEVDPLAKVCRIYGLQ